MMILKNLLKKLNFSIFWQVVIGIGLIWIATTIAKYSKANDNEYTSKITLEIASIKSRIDSISKDNARFISEQLIITKKLDSLKNLKSNEDENYKNKIVAINNASIINDTEWFFSKLDSLKYKREFSISSKRIK